MKRTFTAIIIVYLFTTFSVRAQSSSTHVSWSPSPDPDMMEYRLFRAVNSTGNFNLLCTIVHPETLVFDNLSIQPGNLYAYTVAAVDSAGNQSGFSDTVQIGIPEITWSVSEILSGQATRIPLSEIFSDPDDALQNLVAACSGEDHLQISIANGEINVTPVPLNYLGSSHFTINVQDPDGFYDQRTIALNVVPSLGVNHGGNAPATFSVSQNYPNPFNPQTEIQFAIPENSQVEIAVYNSLGQKVRNLLSDYRSAGYYSVIWDGTNNLGQHVGSGTYIYVVKAGNRISSKKMILLK